MKKKSTVEIGNDFEAKSYDIIEKALNNKELGLIPEYCTVKRKATYPSSRRKKGIIFDLAIEVTPPNSDRPTLLYLIECKSYTSSVPVSEVALFAQYISEINNYSVKGVFITDNELQSGAMEEILSHGMMLIKVDNDNYNIVHYKNEKQHINKDSLDEVMLNALHKALLPQEIKGLQKLSTNQIENLALSLINEFDSKILNNAKALPLKELLDFLKEKYDLKFEYSDIKDFYNKDILGYYNSEDNRIIINSTIQNSVREPFVIAHEIGHFILHRNLKVNESVYNNFKDTSFSLFQQRYTLENPKNWIEWQANKFASSLLLPEKSFKIILVLIQSELGVRNQGTIFLDEQQCNKDDFRNIVEKMAIHFRVSKTSIEYRLNDLNLIQKPRRTDDEDSSRELLRKMSILATRNF